MIETVHPDRVIWKLILNKMIRDLIKAMIIASYQAALHDHLVELGLHKCEPHEHRHQDDDEYLGDDRDEE